MAPKATTATPPRKQLSKTTVRIELSGVETGHIWADLSWGCLVLAIIQAGLMDIEEKLPCRIVGQADSSPSAVVEKITGILERRGFTVTTRQEADTRVIEARK